MISCPSHLSDPCLKNSITALFGAKETPHQYIYQMYRTEPLVSHYHHIQRTETWISELWQKVLFECKECLNWELHTSHINSIICLPQIKTKTHHGDHSKDLCLKNYDSSRYFLFPYMMSKFWNNRWAKFFCDLIDSSTCSEATTNCAWRLRRKKNKTTHAQKFTEKN